MPCVLQFPVEKWKQKIAGEDSPITVGFSHVYLSLAPFLISSDGPQRQVRVHSRDFLRMAVLCKKVGSWEGLQTPAAGPLLVLPEEKNPGGHSSRASGGDLSCSKGRSKSTLFRTAQALERRLHSQQYLLAL